jgi:hypothetical protein
MFLDLGLLVFVPTNGCNSPSVLLKCYDILFVCLFQRQVIFMDELSTKLKTFNGEAKYNKQEVKKA